MTSLLRPDLTRHDPDPACDREDAHPAIACPLHGAAADALTSSMQRITNVIGPDQAKALADALPGAILILPRQQVAHPDLDKQVWNETIALIQEAVSVWTDIPRQRLLVRDRTAEVVWARYVAMYLCVRLLPMASRLYIGKRFMKREHTAVTHAIQSVENRMAQHPDVRIEVEDMDASIRAALAELRHTHSPTT
ncbi:MAG TPA: helix-turn-helix domain-containing protein [Candidatus Kapabacteria bacterium]|nr:helix-turn-helix domain-containing protein [Candidatus Kapabacteria bacterium]